MNAAVESEALVVIGTIESEYTWNKVDYAAPLKIGVAQWTDSAAATLLDNLPSSDKAHLSQSLIDNLTNYTASDPFWKSRYLDVTEANSIVEALSSYQAEAYQTNIFNSMLSDYADVMIEWGCNPDGSLSERKTFIFLATIYHVNIAIAGSICSAVGTASTTQTIYDALMNKPDASNLRDWARVKALIDNWDGGLNPEQGSTDQPWIDAGSPGDGQTMIAQVESQIQKIGYTGQQLIVYGKDNPYGVVCYRATNNLWYPHGNTAAPPTPTPITPPQPVTPATQSDFEAMRQLWYDYERAWSYGNGAGRLDPVASGYTDCSGCIWWAVNQIRPDLAESLGNYSTPQSRAGSLVAEGQLSSTVTIDISILKEGDIVLVSKNGRYTANGDSHVEWYFGNDTLWGAPSAPLPRRTQGTVNDYLRRVSATYSTYMIRRFL